MSITPNSDLGEDSVTALLEIRQVTKTFTGVTALDNVSLDVRRGEVLGLLGENGAGKSTLLKILSGVQPPSGGTVTFEGQEIDLPSPQAAMVLGIITIYQELSLIPTLSVAENIFVGRIPTTALGLVDWRTMNANAADVLAEVGLSLSPHIVVSALSVAEQQMVEIARAVSRASKLIIMDEPTSALSHEEVETLLVIIGRLRQRGVSVLFVTHRLEEASRVCDRMAVLRDGRLITVLVPEPGQRMPLSTIVEKMVGRAASELYARPARRDTAGEILLSIRDLRTARNPEAPHAMVLSGIDLDIRAGEILGVAGLVGSGRTELARAVFGADPIISGVMHLDGREFRPKSPREAIELGIGLVPEDRKQHGIFPALGVLTNYSIATLRAYSSAVGIMSERRERGDLRKYQSTLSIRMSGLDQIISGLSGGNQQKVILARWLAGSPRLLIVDEPTRGVDVGAKAEVHQILVQLAAKGIAVLMISSELPEILAVSDRIATMREGRITGVLNAFEATEERLIALMALNQQESTQR